MRRFVLLFGCLGVLASPAAWSAVPSTISYQGVLTDNSGNLVPDGPYDMTFRIYDLASGGAALFTESYSGPNQVAVSKGGFSVILGTLAPLGLPFDVPYYLGVQVGGGAELLPRVPLTAGPYSLSLRLPFAGVSSGPTPTLHLSNPGGGPAAQFEPRLDVGSPTSNADLRWYASGTEACGVIRGIQGVGGDLEIFDEVGAPLDALTFNFQGEGGFLYVAGNSAGSRYGYLDGNGDGASNPRLELAGQHAVTLDTGQSGDAAVQLPSGSVSAGEMLNEPGITQGVGPAQVSITSNSTFQDAVTTTLQVPVPGYVVVEASSYVTHVFSTHNAIVSVQIDETVGGGVDAAHNVWAGIFAPPDFQPFYLPVSTRRTYFKNAGTYTFRLEARREGDTDGTVVLNYPVITATYVPTSYGAVNQIVAGGESASFEKVRPFALTAPDGSTASGAEVDLRELEVRAARLSAEAERAQRHLADARLRTQMDALATRRQAGVATSPAAAKP